MKIIFYIFLMLTILFLVGCVPENKGINSLSDSASIFCEEQNGIVDTKSSRCYFDDGSYCEQLDFHSGDCYKGTLFACTKEERGDRDCTMWGNKTVCGDNGITYMNRCSACANFKVINFVKGKCE